MTLQELVTRYDEVIAAKSAFMKNGQSYSIHGSHSVTMGTQRDFDREEARLREQILIRSGRRARHVYRRG